MQPGVPGGNAVRPHDLGKIPSVLRAVVSLHHGDCEAPRVLGFQHGLRGQPGAEFRH